MQSQREIDIFHHAIWTNKVTDKLQEFFISSAIDPHEARVKFMAETGKLCDMLGINDPMEVGLLNLQHFHTFNETEIEAEFEKLGYEKELTKLFKTGKLSLIQPQIYLNMHPLSSLSDIFEQGNLDKKTAYLFDPYYGILIIRGSSKIYHRPIALGAFMKEVSISPKALAGYLLANPQVSLNIGLRIAWDVFKSLFDKSQIEKMKKDETPDLIVNSEEEYYRLIDEINTIQKARAPSVQIWFRGQSSDYLMPDRSELAIADIVPYSSIQDSSLVPSLYRNIDKYIEYPQSYTHFVQHYGNWCLRSKLLFGPHYIVKRNGIEIEDPSFNLPEKCFVSSSLIIAGVPEDESQIMDEMGPKFHITVTNEKGEIIDTYVKHEYPGLSAYQSNIVLQHYGCPTSALDITNDPEVAAFFATHRLLGAPENLVVKDHDWNHETETKNWPTIYVFGLVQGLHPFLNSSKILRETEALRPVRQSCGLLSGSGNLCRNYGARYICFKIRLAPTVKFTKLKKASYLFPDEKEDSVLAKLLKWEQNESKNGEIYFPVYKVTEP